MATIDYEKWHEVKEIFYAALQRPPEDREQFLNESCKGDDYLRREVESLLSSSEAAGSFMENPAVGEIAEAIAGNNEKLRVNQTAQSRRSVALRQMACHSKPGVGVRAGDSKLARLSRNSPVFPRGTRE